MRTRNFPTVTISPGLCIRGRARGLHGAKFSGLSKAESGVHERRSDEIADHAAAVQVRFDIPQMRVYPTDGRASSLEKRHVFYASPRRARFSL